MLEQYEDYARRIRINVHFNNSPDQSQTIDPLRLTHTNSQWQPPLANVQIEKYLSNVKANLIHEVESIDSSKITTRQYSPPWLVETLKELRENKEIIITEADKNMGVAVVKTSEYVQLGFKHLMNSTSYELCSVPPDFDELWAVLEDILDRHERLTYFDEFSKSWKRTKLANYLLQLKGRDELKLGTFYMLMKVHKTPLSGRPIVSSINTITYFASKYIDLKLQPIYKTIPSFIGSSQDLVLDLYSNRCCSENDYILCADVDSLYPNIPIEKGLQMFRESIIRNNENVLVPIHLPDPRLTEDEIDFICDLMRFVLENNYFTFGNLIFRQTQGTAMGTPAAVVFACLFLDSHESNILAEKEHFDTLFLYYKRFIDDIFAIFPTKESAELFIDKFNNHPDLPTIKCSNFTIDYHEGTFLDLTIFKGETYEESDLLDIKVFQKEQNKYLYLPRNSFHPKAIFPAFIVSEINRYRFNCTNDKDFEVVKEEFRKRLLARGYTEEFLAPLFTKGKSREELINQAQERRISRFVSKKPKIIFKTLHLPQTRGMRIKSGLEIPEAVLGTRQGYELFHRNDPVICYSNPPSIQSFFSQKRNKIHDLQLRPVASNDGNEIAQMVKEMTSNIATIPFRGNCTDLTVQVFDIVQQNGNGHPYGSKTPVQSSFKPFETVGHNWSHDHP